MLCRYLITCFALVLLIVPWVSVAGETAGGSEVAAEMAVGLGGDNFRETFAAMKTSAPESVRALIGELRVVDANHVPGFLQEQNPEVMHVIWCVRMLRALTGQEFTAKTEYVFAPDEEQREYWLKHRDAENIPFFASRMSNDSVFIAPEDVQMSVIEQWKKWFDEEGAGQGYATELPSADEWYY